jgi:hypothetical protein
MSAMQLSDFILLDEAKMKSTVLHEGVLIAKRRNSDHLVFLFQMDDYYVETYCNMQTKAVSEYRAFTETNALDPYLEAIAIDELLH